MEAIVFLLAVSPVLCNFAAFLAGARAEKVLRDQLANFYVSVQGDWREIYRRPAALIAAYLAATFGKKPLRFPVYVAFYSLITTSLLTMAHLNLTIPNGVDSAGPILTGEGKFNFDLLWSMYLAPNLIGDLICWPLSLFLFARLAKARPISALLIAFLIIVLGLATFIFVARLEAWTWDFISIPQGPLDLSLPSGPGSSEWIRACSALSEVGLPVERYTFDYWGAVPLAVFLPAVLLGVTTLLAVIIVVAKPLLYRPLLLLMERLDASSKAILNSLAAFLVGLAVIFTAVRIYLHKG